MTLVSAGDNADRTLGKIEGAEQASKPMDDAQDPEMLAAFVAESLQGLQSVEQDLLTLEADGGADVELVNRIFRAVHSIKGAGSFLDLTNLVTVSHRAETLLDDIRAGRRAASAEITDAVLGAVDSLVAMLEEPDQGATYNCETILDQLDAILKAEASADAASAAAPPTTANPATAPSNQQEPASAIQDEPAVDRDPELLNEFINESLQGLEDIEQDLLELESVGSSDHELVNRIFRAIHSIKGAASFLELNNLVSVTHLAETILDRIRSNQLEATATVTDAILSTVDAVTEMLRADDHGDHYDCRSVVSKLEAVLADEPSGAASPPEDPELLARLIQEHQVANPVFRLDIDLAKLHAAIDIQEGVVEGLESVGRIIHSSLPTNAIDSTNEGSVRLYFETVLEAEILSEHLGLDAAAISPVDWNAASAAPPAKPNPKPPAVEERSNPKSNATPEPPAATPSPKNQPQPPTTKATPPTSPPKPAPAASANTPAKTETRNNVEQFMRVPARILHELLEWTGNMVMARNQLLNEFDFRESNAFRTLSQAITGVHETVIETRMQTTGSLFERYRRVVRDLSRKLKKEVAFHIEGGDLELDRTILESFADPLTHLVRNCIDHALETPDERIAAGKNRQGNVYLRSYIQSGEIILAVQDDGRGIDAEVICAKAISKGILSEAQAADLSEDQKVMLIFAPGFSTKEQATDVSGRGVGMDVVKNNIEKVGGTIALKTRLGEGSTISAHLPLAKALVSSSLTTALIIQIAGERFAIPETAISEIIQYDDRTLEHVRLVDGRCVYQHRDQLVAIIDLRSPLHMQADQVEANKPSAKTTAPDFAPAARGKRSCLVIIQFRDQLFGTVVDEVVGMQEIIVRSNPQLIQECMVYSGHTVLGNGRIALILDINGIVNKMQLKFPDQAGPAHGHHESIGQLKVNPNTQKMLIFNNADNEYFAIPIELVAFIERIQTSDLRRVGEKEFCQLKAETLSVVRLEDFLPVTPLNRERQDMCLIRPAAIEHPIGVITGLDLSVIDVAETFESRLDDDNGIVGTFYYNDNLVMLLDLFCVLEKHAPEKIGHQEDEARPARILVAEDSLFFRKLIGQYITRDEWQVEIVNDGQQAYEALTNEPTRYDLLISDINMPRMDGFELVKKLRAERRFDTLPVVALTTMSDEHFREKGLRLGFDRYVIKIDKREVRSTVSECLRIRRKPRSESAATDN